MPIHHHAQRRHIISSLDSLLYQLHTLSFLLAPSLLVYICRCATQFQFSRTGELDAKRSLRFWYAVVVFVNAGSLWAHAFDGPPTGRTVMLDFVGMAHHPSRILLLILDTTIIFLQIILTTLAYETSLSLAMSADTPDPLIPSSPTSNTTETATYTTIPALRPSSPSLSENDDPTTKTPFLPSNPSSSTRVRVPVIDLRFRHLIHRLTTAAPSPPERPNTDLDVDSLTLPMPNTTRLARSMRILAQLRARRNDLQAERNTLETALAQRRARRSEIEAEIARRRGQGGGDDEHVYPPAQREPQGRIPGAMDSDDGDAE